MFPAVRPSTRASCASSVIGRPRTDESATSNASTWRSSSSVHPVSSYGRGPGAEDAEDVSAGVHGGQVWRYDVRRDTLTLAVVFTPTDDFQGPDNITVVLVRWLGTPN